MTVLERVVPAALVAALLAGQLALCACAGAARPPATPEPPAAAPAAAAEEPQPPPAEAPEPPPESPPPPPAAALPDSAAGRALAEWLGVYNRGDAAEVERFVAGFSQPFLDQLPAPALAAFHLQSLEATGTLTPVEIVRASEHEIRVVAAAAAGGEMEVTVTVEPAPPHRIAGLRLVTAPEGAGGGG